MEALVGAPGEGPSRGLLSDCEILANLRLKITVISPTLAASSPASWSRGAAWLARVAAAVARVSMVPLSRGGLRPAARTSRRRHWCYRSRHRHRHTPPGTTGGNIYYLLDIQNNNKAFLHPIKHSPTFRDFYSCQSLFTTYSTLLDRRYVEVDANCDNIKALKNNGKCCLI